jgi:lipopolysaccharide export system permease protein
MKILDRLVILAYVRSCLFCLFSLLSLYVIIDLFTNLDEFFNNDQGFAAGLVSIGRYYMYSSTRILDRLCEPIVLLAGAFTVAWMQRNNELLPLLSAGVPTRRVLRPVFIGALLFLGLGIANQELIIPRIAPMLVRQRNDMDGVGETFAQASYDSTGIHVEGHKARRKDQTVSLFFCTIPDAQGNGLVHLSAKEAQYIPPGSGPYTGGWLLTDTTPPSLTEWDNPKLARMIDHGRWFVYTRDINFETITRNGTWYMLFSTQRLHELLNNSDARRLEAMAVLFHMRLTRPIVGFLLVVMGLSVILRDPNRNVFVSTGYCLVLCALFFGVVYGCKFLGDHEYFAPALAAWLPVIIFGPTAFVMFDAIHT